METRDALWSIQYLRAFAALAVVIFHFMEGAPTQWLIGAAGVDLFFVISGFIMWMLVSTRESAPSVFMWRRLIRIVPVYWAATFATLAVNAHQPSFLRDIDPSFENTWKSLLFIPHDSHAGASPVLGPGWTLNYEMFFYALVTLVLFMPTRRRLALLSGALAALVGIGAVIRLAGVDVIAAPALHVYTSPMLLEFLAGIFIAEAWRRGRLPAAPVAWAMVVSAIGLYFACLYLLAPLGSVLAVWDLLHAAWGAPSALLLTGALALENAGKMGRSTFIRLIGDASYSIYLIHLAIIASVNWEVGDAPLAARLLLTAGLSIAAAIAVYLLFERPVTRWLRRVPALIANQIALARG